MSTVVLGVRYDGAPFCGWQIQPDQPSVQATLEKALAAFARVPLATMCAGRTDTGVHATAQVVSIDTELVRGEQNWVRGLNSHLPASVAISWARTLDRPFHARFDARSRTYEYWLYNDPIRDPLFEGKMGWVFRPLDEKAMQQAAECLVGEHDFTSFRASQCQAASPVRTITDITIVRRGKFVGTRITANAFLHHMVRNIMGSLIAVGIGKEPVSWMKTVLEARNRDCAAPTFSAAGLYLTRVQYPDYLELPQNNVSPFAEWWSEAMSFGRKTL